MCALYRCIPIIVVLIAFAATLPRVRRLQIFFAIRILSYLMRECCSICSLFFDVIRLTMPLYGRKRI